MRPIKLVMSAFGPYAKEEIIDFEVLDGKNIFLITGPTGAGKTTIFDAISYALFGEASGSTRENDSLRSDFANKDRLTYVELEFELRGERYHIRRVPQQLKPKVKGEGYTNQSAEAEFTLPNGKVKTGAMNVSNEVNTLLGINKEQFKQIVMLPQGEFKKLLLADSREREGIFRKIFSTYTYEKIQSLLYDKARSLYKELEKTKVKVGTHVSNIKSDESIHIGEYIDFDNLIKSIENIIIKDKENYKEVENRLNNISKEIELLKEEKIRGKNNNDLLKEKENISIKLREMLLDEENLIKKEEKLKKASNAKEIVYIEENLIAKEENQKLKGEEKERLIKLIISIKDELKRAEKDLLEEQGKEGEKNKLIEEINILKEKEPKIRSLENKRLKIEDLSKKLKINNIQVERNEKIIKELKEEREINTNKLKSIAELEKENIILEKDIESKNKLIEQTRDVYKAIAKYYDEKKKYDEIAIKFTEVERTYKLYKDEYERKEEIYMKEQAGLLALSLEDKIPCPVCGSLDHPQPASRVENIPTEAELKNCKKIFEKSQEEYNLILMETTKVKQSIKALINDVINPQLSSLSNKIKCNDSFVKESFDEIKAAGIELSNDIKKIRVKIDVIIKEISNKEKLENRISEIDVSIKEKEKNLTILANENTAVFGELRGEEETLKDIEKEVPEGLRSIGELTKRISILESKLAEFNRRLRELEESKNKTKNLLVSEEARLEGIEKLLIELNQDIDKTRDIIKEKLKEYKFNDYEEYNNIKDIIPNIERMKEEISFYKEEVKSLKDRERDLVEKTKGLDYVDLEKIDRVIEEKVIMENDMTKSARDLYSLITNNSSILKEIRDIEKVISKKEEEYKVIGELSNLANGRKSPYITFERFVLASYFQEIIDSANIRLSKMTNERFILKRKEDKGKGTSQQGLELEVYDNYTGKSRHVKTLSGGESFKASLALALGLSDVVQANAGGISLDTMFIDEGFGTLDPESLENAINSLIDLQKGGRLVGIISHVPELKERIESQLEIQVSPEGSSAKFNIN